MFEPIVFISRHRIKEGKLEGFKEVSRQNAARLEAEKPGTVVFLAFINEDGTEVSFHHLFPDAEAMDHHLEGAAERSRRAYEFLEPIRFEIFGQPSEQAMQMMGQAAESAGVPLILTPEVIGGYIRLPSS
jgi:quinol monooxygenase YgiN